MVANVNSVNLDTIRTLATTTSTSGGTTSLFRSAALNNASTTMTMTPEVEAAAAEVERVSGELNIKKEKKAANDRRIEELQKEIEELQEKIQAEINKAIEKAEGLAEDQKKQMETSSADILKAYTNREISYEEMQSQVKTSFQNISSNYGTQITDAMNTAVYAGSEMNVLNKDVDEIITITEENRFLQVEIEQGEAELSSAVQKLEAAIASASASASSGSDGGGGGDGGGGDDPIGFVKDGVRYDFLKDKDSNGKLSNAKEFLGAENQWAEMTALDTDGNGTVDSKEFEKAGIKVAVTVNGKTFVKTVSELGIDNVDLSSYKKDGSVDKDGNTLLGTFSLTMGDAKIDNAYNTFDTTEWLSKTYDFSDNKNNIGRFGLTLGSTDPMEENEEGIEGTIKEYMATQRKLQENLSMAFGELNITQNQLTVGKTEKDMEATDKMKVEKEKIDKEDEKKAEEEKKEKEKLEEEEKKKKEQEQREELSRRLKNWSK